VPAVEADEQRSGRSRVGAGVSGQADGLVDDPAEADAGPVRLGGVRAERLFGQRT
jgi:hypothetical protein